MQNKWRAVDDLEEAVRLSGVRLISQTLSVRLSFRNGLLELFPFDAHTSPIFINLKILKFDDIIKFQINKIMYLYKNGLLPESFNDMFLLNSDIHPYNTRNKNSLHLPYCRTNLRKFSVRF